MGQLGTAGKFSREKEKRMGEREHSNGAMLDIAISAAIGRVEPAFASNTQPPAPIQTGMIKIKLRFQLPAPMRK